MIDIVRVGERIAELRRQSELSQEELAAELFVTRQALSKWERGSSQPPLDAIARMSRRFGVSFEDILGLDQEESDDVDPEDIFKGHDRAYILSKIADGALKVNLPDVFYQLSPKERMYLLHHIKYGGIAVDRRELWVKLTPSEQKFLGGYYDEICEGNT